jgi:Zn finger protein HypA/HybF involved in hydrogenase expression
MDMTLIQGTVSGLKLASDIAKGFLEAKSLADVQGKVIELQSAILAAQSTALAANAEQAAMANEIAALKEEIARVQAWEKEKVRYKLIAPWAGTAVYGLKKSMRESEPPHIICTTCYENRRKSILNPMVAIGGWVSFVCPTCKAQVPTGYRGGVQPEYAPD